MIAWTIKTHNTLSTKGKKNENKKFVLICCFFFLNLFIAQTQDEIVQNKTPETESWNNGISVQTDYSIRSEIKNCRDAMSFATTHIHKHIRTTQTHTELSMYAVFFLLNLNDACQLYCATTPNRFIRHPERYWNLNIKPFFSSFW